jgi:hypothetical protein
MAIPGRTGELFEPGSASALVEALQGALDKGDIATRYLAGLQEAQAAYAPGLVLDAYEAALSEAAKAKP